MEFDQIGEALANYPGIDSPAFLHGMLSGLMCADNEIKESAWIQKILQEAEVKSVKESFLVMLHDMYLETEAGLNGSGFEFNLCLPDEGESIVFRSAMIGQWVEGFLYGMGLAGKSAQKLTKDVNELLKDFAVIAQIEVDGLDQLEREEQEQAEDDFMHLSEFVKVGVLTINETLNPAESSPIMTTECATETLH